MSDQGQLPEGVIGYHYFIYSQPDEMTKVSAVAALKDRTTITGHSREKPMSDFNVTEARQEARADVIRQLNEKSAEVAA